MKRTVPLRDYTETIVRGAASAFLAGVACGGIFAHFTGAALVSFAFLTAAINALLMVAQDIAPIPNPGTGLPPKKGAPR